MRVELDRLRRLSEIISRKWDLVVLAALAEQPLRYMELAQEIRKNNHELTEGVLSKNLRRLTATGLIHQEAVGNRHHVYALTPRGQQMVEILRQIAALELPGEQPSDGDDDG